MAFKKLASDDVPVLPMHDITGDYMEIGSSETKEAPGRDFAKYDGSKNPMDADVINKKNR
jgi:hypothetical protein